MFSRVIRGLILFLIAVVMYILIASPEVLKYIYPQLQVALLALDKAILSASLGYVLGVALFPHKIKWSNHNVWQQGAIARVIIILVFIYLGVYYA